MSAQIVRASLDEKDLIAEMMQVYLDELSAYTDIEPEDDGSFRLDDTFDSFWTESTRHPLLIVADDIAVGFCLVRQVEPGVHSIAEFYIEEPHRGAGLGTLAAHVIFARFPGNWQVAQLADNHLAQAFWHRAIREFTGGNYAERWSDSAPEGPMQVFVTPEEDER